VEVWRISNCSPGAEDIFVVVAKVRIGVVVCLYDGGLTLVRVNILAGAKILEDSM
jgi:hypothetical protein